MKKFILSIVMAVSMSFVFAQYTAEFSLVVETPPAPGENFYVALYLNSMVNPNYAFGSIKSAQIGISYDPAVLTPFDASGPGVKYYSNPSLMFTELPGTIANSVAAPGDLRFVLTQLSEPGWEPGYYTPYPIKLFDLNFTYAAGGGSSNVNFTTEAKLEPVISGVAGGDLKFIPTIFTEWQNNLYTLTLNNTTVGGGGAIDYMWVGGTVGFETDWFTDTNWSPVGVPTEADNVEFPGTKAGPCILTGPAIVTNLTISGGSLTVAPFGSLNVNGTFLNNGYFGITSDGVGNSGSFIDALGVNVGAANSYEFQRTITNVTPFGAQAGWHFISSPLLAGEFNSDDLLYYYLNYWNPATQLYVPVVGAVPCVPAPMMPNGFMEGWSIKYDAQYAIDCAAGMDDFVINMEGTAFSDANTVASVGVVAGYNFLGNPFPSSLDPTAFTWPATTPTNTGYMWDGLTGANAWVVFDGTGLGGNVPPTQGFFVNATGAGLLDVTGSRTHTGPAWYKDALDYLKLKATVEGAQNADITYIRFNDAATAGLDKEWDGLKMFNNVEATPDIYTYAGDEALCINTQPAVDLVHMDFVCQTAGTYTIEAIETGNFEFVVLEDGLTGEQTDLLENSYTFNYGNVGQVHPFVVHFTPLGTIEHEANSIRIWASDNQVNVVVPNTGTIVVYNMMGQEVTSKDADPGLNTLPVNDVNTYYIVQVVTESNAKTGKVFIK